MITKTEAIKNFLTVKTHADLAGLYNPAMECQVLVSQGDGERIQGEFKGREYIAYTDGIQIWKSFRIPLHAASNPEYTDSEIKFDLAQHCLAIGLTGWDYKNKQSRWVGFDFDALMNHTQGLTSEELQQVIDNASKVDWITLRKSTSGHGLHLYVLLPDVETQNHTEHAALARSVLAKLSALTGYNFNATVDNCGGVLWVYHTKMIGTSGLTLLKQGTVLQDVPNNWRDQVKVINRSIRTGALPASDPRDDLFEQLSGSRVRVPLDTEHRRLINYIEQSNSSWSWDIEKNMLVTHTFVLKKAHTDLGFKGIYDTISQGTDLTTPNCFAFPSLNGSWSLRRFTPGVQEAPTWTSDSSGWTVCSYNVVPTLREVCIAAGALEDTKKGFNFREAEVAAQAAQNLGIFIKVGNSQLLRPTRLHEAKDGRLLVAVEHKTSDRSDEMPGFLVEKGNWIKFYNLPATGPVESDTDVYDEIVRHVVTIDGEDYGWSIKADGVWRNEPLAHIKVALASIGFDTKDVSGILGSSVFKCWRLVNKPFQPEYTGGREWNRNAAQLRFTPTVDTESLSYPTWLKVLSHCGSGLDDHIENDPWCKVNGIATGGDYLKCWIASMLQEPAEPLPYLFLYGPQDSGKSILHEALSLLFTKGYMRADAALISNSGFNGELESSILCIVEETDLKDNRNANNRIKDWVTSRDLLIRHLYQTPYHSKNLTHWLQCSNTINAVPIFPGDTRITVCYVKPLDPLELIPKKVLIPMLEKEAGDFLAAVLGIDLPPSTTRLNIPVLLTEDKMAIQTLNQTALESFILEHCRPQEGAWLKFGDFYDKFTEHLEPGDLGHWSKIRVGKEIPPQFVKGRNRHDAQHYIGNITWKEDTQEYIGKYFLREGFLSK